MDSIEKAPVPRIKIGSGNSDGVMRRGSLWELMSVRRCLFV